MPPKSKKGEAVKPAPLIGRIGTSLKCGILGLPNVGKSTFFNVLTKSAIPAENFPFCTIDPNESRVAVPDARYDNLCKIFKPASEVPAYLSVVDIAGLVKGAHEGEGLGNAFLSHIQACDALYHMTRAFEDDDITHVEGDIDPVRDLKIIFDELRFKDIAFCKDSIVKAEKATKSDKMAKPAVDCLTKVLKLLEEDEKGVRFSTWTGNEIEVLNKYLFITSKPMVYLVNLSEKDYIRKKNKHLLKIKEWIDVNDPGAILIPFSGALELKLLDFSTDEERTAYLEEKKTISSLTKIIQTGYKTLQLEYFFTCGADEVKCWMVQKGTKAPHAAGRIHGDMEKGFIMAEVMKYEDFNEHGSEGACKAAGKYLTKGREYVVQDGDILFIKFNAGAGLGGEKKKK